MPFKRLQMIVRGVSDEMNDFFKSEGRIIPSRETLLKYRELTDRIVTNTKGAPAGKQSAKALEVQTKRLQMINKALEGNK